MNRFQLDESDDFLGPSDAKRHRGFVDVTQGQLTKDSSSHVTSLEWLASVAERINQTMHYQVRLRQGSQTQIDLGVASDSKRVSRAAQKKSEKKILSNFHLKT